MQGRGSGAGRGGAAEITRGVTSGSSGVHTSAAPPCGPVITGLAPEPGPGQVALRPQLAPGPPRERGGWPVPPSFLLSRPFFLFLSSFFSFSFFLSSVSLSLSLSS